MASSSEEQLSSGALAFIAGYTSSTDEDSNNEDKANVPEASAVRSCKGTQQDLDWRRRSSSSSDTSGSESSEDSDSDSSSSSSTSLSSEQGSDGGKWKQQVKRRECKVKGEVGIKDLPPIEDLHISVPEYECILLGHVSSIVDTLVVVRSIAGTPALDLETVLFLDRGQRSLGQVFDVMGPVREPFYCIRFNSVEHVEIQGVAIGTEVYCAPRTPHTSYIFFEQLMKLKGTDASWKKDREAPSKHADYSDDEVEKKSKVGTRGIKKVPKNDCQAPPRKIQRAYRPQIPSQCSENAFYRQGRRYVPNSHGAIRWNHPHANMHNFQIPPNGQFLPNPFSVPPPPPPPPPPPSFYLMVDERLPGAHQREGPTACTPPSFVPTNQDEPKPPGT